MDNTIWGSIFSPAFNEPGCEAKLEVYFISWRVLWWDTWRVAFFSFKSMHPLEEKRVWLLSEHIGGTGLHRVSKDSLSLLGHPLRLLPQHDHLDQGHSYPDDFGVAMYQSSMNFYISRSYEGKTAEAAKTTWRGLAISLSKKDPQTIAN